MPQFNIPEDTFSRNGLKIAKICSCENSSTKISYNIYNIYNRNLRNNARSMFREREREREKKKQGRGNDSCHFYVLLLLPFFLCKHLIPKQEWNIST